MRLRNGKNPVPGTKQLNELMLNYAQVNNLSGVASCLQKGADVDYCNEALLLIAVYTKNFRMLKFVLKLSKCANIDLWVVAAENLQWTKGVNLLEERRLTVTNFGTPSRDK